MASGIVINGQLILTPGVYTRTVASALGGTNPAARGILAVITEAKAGGAPAQPVLLSNSSALRTWLKGDPYLAADLDKACFSPSKDPRIPNGAQAVIFVRANPADLATLTKAAGAVNEVVFSASDYGALGNNIKVKQAGGSSTGKKVTVTDGVTTDVIDNIGANPMLNVSYDDTSETAYVNWVKGIVLPFDATNYDAGVYVRWNAKHASGSGATATWTWNSSVKLVVDGPISVTNLDSASGVDYVFHGVDKDTGLAANETVTFAAHTATTKTTTTNWSSITSIVLPDLAGADVTFEADAIAMPASTYNTLGKVIDRINSKGGDYKFSASAPFTGRTSFLVTDMDRTSGANGTEFGSGAADVTIPGKDFAANLHYYVAAINAGTSLLTCAKADNATGLPDDFTAYEFLTGGADNTADGSDWQAALDSIKNVNVSAVWVNSVEASVLSKLNSHVYYANGRGRMERVGYVGIAEDDGSTSTLSELRANIAALNYCGLADPWVQPIKDYDLDGVVQTYGPQWGALRCAAMEQGRNAEDSILFATMDIVGYVDEGTTWDSYNYTEQLCDAGAAFVQQDPRSLVFRIMNESTTHKTDDNPVLTSPFAVGSWLRSTQNVRIKLFDRIGRGNWTGGAETCKSVINAELERQVAAHEIKAFDPSKTTVDDLGNAFNAAWAVAPAEAIKFISGTAYVTRIPSNA